MPIASKSPSPSEINKFYGPHKIDVEKAKNFRIFQQKRSQNLRKSYVDNPNHLATHEYLAKLGKISFLKKSLQSSQLPNFKVSLKNNVCSPKIDPQMTSIDLTSATKMSLKLFSPQNLRYSTINNSCSPARDHCGTAAVT
jgi:hypothetical protein